jgi:hypothetical protein
MQWARSIIFVKSGMGAISDADARVHRSVVVCSYDGKPR